MSKTEVALLMLLLALNVYSLEGELSHLKRELAFLKWFLGVSATLIVGMAGILITLLVRVI